MVRKRIEGTALNSWEEVDACLREIGRIDRELRLLEAMQNEMIDKIKEETRNSAQPLQDKKTGLELAIRDYCEANRAEFAKVKTKVLIFGSVGFRLTTRIMIRRVAETLQALKDLALTQCIRVKEEPDKEAMKNLSDETLAEVGACRKTENVFGYEINQEKIREAA